MPFHYSFWNFCFSCYIWKKNLSLELHPMRKYCSLWWPACSPLGRLTFFTAATFQGVPKIVSTVDFKESKFFYTGPWFEVKSLLHSGCCLFWFEFWLLSTMMVHKCSIESSGSVHSLSQEAEQCEPPPVLDWLKPVQICENRGPHAGLSQHSIGSDSPVHSLVTRLLGTGCNRTITFSSSET